MVTPPVTVVLVTALARKISPPSSPEDAVTLTFPLVEMSPSEVIPVLNKRAIS
jgi:hypothetical protein